MKNKLLLLAMGILLTAQTLTAQVPSYVPTNGLVGYWPFNGNANDESGNGNNGTVNGATLTADRNGNANSAYSFDGVNDYIQTTAPTINSSITLSLWVYDEGGYPNNNSLNPRYISSEFCNGGFALVNNVNTPGGIFFARNRGDNSTELFASTSPTYNTYQHIVFTYNGQIGVFYINGNLINTISNVGSISQTTNLFFGKSGCVFGQMIDALKGKLDDLGIWDRALTPSEVQLLYTGCSTPAPTGSASQTLCSGSTVADLTATGTNVKWYATSTGGTALASTTALVSGTTYYASQTVSGCESTLRLAVTVTLNPLPNATISGTTTVCAGSNAMVTFTGTPYATVTYTENGGALQTIVLNATGTASLITTSLTVNSIYTLVSVTSNGCTQPLSESAFINVNPLPTATISGTTTVCKDSVSANITFTGANGGAPYIFIYNINGGAYQTITTSFGNSVTLFVPTNTVGLFNYQLISVISEFSTCSQLQTGTSTVTVSSTAAPTGSSSQTLCSGSTVANLTATGTNIQWYATSTGGTALASTTALVNGTTYYASQTVNGCESTTRLAVTVSFTAQPNAGLDGSVIVCESYNFSINLFSLIIGEQAGGVWTRTSGLGGTFNAAAGTFIPAVGASSSTFTYTLTGVAPCVTDTSVATITINYQPNAGVDGSVTVCDSSATIDLNTLITGEQPGGTWTRTSGTGGTLNPLLGTFTPSAGATSSTFQYRIAGVAPCIVDFSTATIIISAQPNAGVDGSVTVCDSSAPFDLNTLITGEQAGGVWSRTSGTGGTFNSSEGTFTPSAGATSSTFEYRITYAAPCVDFSTATVNIIYPFLTPDFSPIPPFCAGGPAPILTSTSPNGIPGTWLPAAIDNTADGTYYFTPFDGLCATPTTLNVTVIAPPPSPSGANNQTVAQGSTLANLLVTGQDIQWYANPFGGTPLPLNTPLVNGTTYYASQTINGCESQDRFPVIVQITLSNNEFDTIRIIYSPNPVIDILNVKASTELKKAKICNVLGQTIFQQRFNSNDIQLNMSDVPSGTYFVNVESDNRKETFKVLKK